MLKTLLPIAALAGLAALHGIAADRPYEDLMKDVQAACANLKKNIDAKSFDAAGADAKKLDALFGDVHKFWSARNAPDAVTFARDAQTAARQAGAAATNSNAEEAMKGFQSLLGNCKGCHAAHREKGPDGKWIIK